MWGSNDIGDETLDKVLPTLNNPGLVLELVEISRSMFGWFTKHPTRIHEYPWVVSQVPNCADKRILDIGSGLSPLPWYFANRGAKVVTIDNSKKIRDSNSDPADWNEWGYYDYSVHGPNITSLNQDIVEARFESCSFDFIYSISVVEHLHSSLRSKMWKYIHGCMRDHGKLILTVDLIPGTDLLWNYSEGIMVENTERHGNLSSLTAEISDVGFENIERTFLRRVPDCRVDCAFLSYNKTC